MKIQYVTAVLLCILSSALLVGCSHMDQIQASAQKETAAWEAVEREAQASCNLLIENDRIPKKKAMEYYECRSKLVHKNVMPVAMFPGVVLELDAKMAEISGDYQNGKVSREEANIRFKKAEAAYANAVSAKLDPMMAVAAYQDENRSNRLAALGHSLRMQSAMQEAAAAQRQPVNVTCTGGDYFGGFKTPVQCRSW